MDSMMSILPQSLGFKRDVTGPSRRVEVALKRQVLARGEVAWEIRAMSGMDLSPAAWAWRWCSCSCFSFGSLQACWRA